MRVKKTLSIDTDFLEKADELRGLLRYPDVSSLIEQLIREEWERRHGPLVLRDDSAAVTPHPAPAHSVTYRKTKRAKDPPKAKTG